MVWGYGWYSLGELLVSGLGLAMIARYVPSRMGGFMMGAYYVAVGLSQYLGSIVANYAHIPDNITDPVQSLTIYVSLFNKLGFVGIACVVIALVMLPLMNKLSASHPIRGQPHSAAGRTQRGIRQPRDAAYPPHGATGLLDDSDHHDATSHPNASARSLSRARWRG
jgi:MFS family permease